MSALVILECNACAALSAPGPALHVVREQAAEDGWAIDCPDVEIHYCPKCSAPAKAAAMNAGVVSLPPTPANRLDVARAGVAQLRDALAGISLMVDLRPQAVISVANLARIRAEQLLAELAS